MQVIYGKSFSEVYHSVVEHVYNTGKEVYTRGGTTLEIAPLTFVVEDARKLLAVPEKRNGNYTFQLAELLWILRGSNDLNEIAHYNKNWRNFEDADEPGILNGAYGERLRRWNGNDDNFTGVDQFVEVYKKLRDDPYSRQAVMIIFDPERDNEIHSDGKYSKDIPCTNYFNFQIRDNKLNMWTVMRSNDLHKGTLYDVPNFMTIQNIIAGWLGVEVGKYTHSAASMHIYESDINNFKEILSHSPKKVYKDNIDYGDPKLTIEQFNEIMPIICNLEIASRMAITKEEISDRVSVIKKYLDHIKNTWWKSVAAQILMYNYRKLGATKEEFNTFLPYVTNEYRNFVENWSEIKK